MGDILLHNKYLYHPLLSDTTLYSGSTQEGTQSQANPGLSKPLACNLLTVSENNTVFLNIKDEKNYFTKIICETT